MSICPTKQTALLVATMSATALASAQDAPSQARGLALEEVVVTAQRRAESLQDAAIAIQAFDQNTLVQNGMESAQDLGLLSPSLGISAGGGPLTSLFVRGVGALTVNPLTDSAVAQNVDGVYLGRSSGAAAQAMYDLERVELLKGPQGTLYGRNATGGVLNYIPQKPVIGENTGSIQADIGNYSKVGVQGAFNVTLADDLAIRIAGNSLDRDGYSDDGTNDQDTYSLRAQVLYEPTDRLSIRVAADYSEITSKGAAGDLLGTYDNEGPPGVDVTNFTPSGLSINSGPTAEGANAIRTGVLHTPSFAPFRPIDADDLYQDNNFTGFMAEINYQMDSGMLTFIPAYRESDQDYQFTGPGFAPAKTEEENEQTSLELRYATDLEGSVNGIIGAFYIEEDISTSGTFAQNYASPMQNYDNGGESWAVFGQVTVDLNDETRLNVGLRYTEDEKYAEGISDTFITFCGGAPFTGNFLTPGPPPFNAFVNGCATPGNMPAHPITNDRDEFIAYFVEQGLIASDSVATVPGMGPPPFYDLTLPGGVPPTPGNPNPILGSIVNVGEGFLSSELDYSETTYRIGLEHDWGDGNLLYVNFETGYRAGGVDLSVAAPTYDPEYIDAFSIGSKNRFMDDTLQLNAEAFWWKYDGQQVTYFTTLQGASSFPIANADATIQGLDVDMVWLVSESTRISANVQFLDAQYDRLTLIADPGVGRFGCDVAGVEGGVESFDCAGGDMLYSPDFGADLTINHELDLGGNTLALTAIMSHRAKQQTNFIFLDETYADSYTTLHLDATLVSSDGDWSVSAYARNVTDEQFLMNTNVSNRGLAYGIYSPPMTYGLRAQLSF